MSTEIEEDNNDKLKRLLKREFKHLVICVTLLIMIWSGYFVAKAEIIIAKDLEHLRSNDYSFVFQVDNVEEDGKDLVLTGWAFIQKVDAKEDDLDVLLYNLKSEKILYPKNEPIVRKDVNEYFLCEYDYLESGFIARIDSKKVKGRNYEILVRDSAQDVIYHTGVYISEGELMYTDPREYVPLDVKGTDLENIVENGVLRVYRPDVGMYVYQYKESLYWIADEYYFFEEDGGTYTQFQMKTTQIAKLPQHRLENGWNWDNIGFEFETKEIIDIDTGKYRVAMSAVPTEYSVTEIWTGYYVDNWVWQQYFRPYYSEMLSK